MELLRGRQHPGVTILPLFARLSAGEQAKVFSKTPGRKIIVSTNVAETSLTIAGIRYVIDTGLARIPSYSPRTRTTSLPVRPISQSSANQRMGRCGRVENGICIRLYDEDDFNGRPFFTAPEILRSNLAEVILRMISLKLGDVQGFPFIDPPAPKSIRDGFDTLVELGAVKVSDKHKNPLSSRMWDKSCHGSPWIPNCPAFSLQPKITTAWPKPWSLPRRCPFPMSGSARLTKQRQPTRNTPGSKIRPLISSPCSTSGMPTNPKKKIPVKDQTPTVLHGSFSVFQTHPGMAGYPQPDPAPAQRTRVFRFLALYFSARHRSFEINGQRHRRPFIHCPAQIPFGRISVPHCP